MISSGDRIRNIAPSARECYFRDEKELRFYKKYTFINCRMECAILETEKLLGCIPWHLPKVLLFYDCFDDALRETEQKHVTLGLQKSLMLK